MKMYETKFETILYGLTYVLIAIVLIVFLLQ